MCQRGLLQRLLLRGHTGCQVAPAYCPLVVLFSEHRTDEPAHRRTVREDAHHICPSPDLLVQTLLGII